MAPTGTRSVSSHGDESPLPLTDASRIKLDYYAPPQSLLGYVTTIYHFRCDDAEIRDMQPAAIGQLTLFPWGKGAMRFAEGIEDRSHELNLLTPTSQAASFTVDGPFHAIGLALLPLGWAALTGLSACEYSNRLLPASDWLDGAEQIGAELAEKYRDGNISGEECGHALAAYAADRMSPPNRRHMELIDQVTKWLGTSLYPPVEQLYSLTSYSRRQTQRLCERYFGLCPQALARKYRALRAAMLLNSPDLPEAAAAHIADSFYDQSHMIREIRHFTGRTPTRFAGADTEILREVLHRRNLREVQVGLPDDLIAGDGASGDGQENS